MSQPTILVVDDDADLREMLVLVLASRGFQVESAADGAAAMERLQQAPRPDALLIDLRMPVVDGTDFLRQVRSTPSLAGLPVIVMSGERGGEAVATKAGASAFLAKPFGILELVAEVYRALGAEEGTRPSA